MKLALAVSAATLSGNADSAVLLDAAAGVGVQARLIDWRGPGWEWADAVLLHTPWDYTEDLPAFSRWLGATSARRPVFNDPAGVAGNTHKSYLLDLQEAGVPLPATRLLRAGRPVDATALRATFGDSAVVAKPAVGAGGRRLSRLPAVADLQASALVDGDGVPSVDILVQEFVPSVLTGGESSLVVIAGRPSHLVRKVPAAGDFRVQASYGGTEQLVELDRTAATVAQLVQPWVAALAYARVDYVLDGNGAPLVMELELTEPDLFLRHCPDAARVLVEHVASSVRAGAPSSDD